jgi:hypothetical protein
MLNPFVSSLLAAFATLAAAALQAVFVIGPSLAYLQQWRDIRRGGGEAFSSQVCLVLLLANILRLFFWYGKRFEWTLAAQSLVMIMMQLLMVLALVRRDGATLARANVSASSAKSSGTSSTTSTLAAASSLSSTTAAKIVTPTMSTVRKQPLAAISLPPSITAAVHAVPRRSAHARAPRHRTLFHCRLRRDFWQWTDFASYVAFLLIFTLVVGVSFFLLLDTDWFIDVVGLLALGIEASLCVPQVVQNYNHGVAGLSRVLVASWCFGDVFKTAYFLSIGAPAQFTVCAVIQVTIDVVVLGQLYYMSTPAAAAALTTKPRRKSSGDPAAATSLSTSLSSPLGGAQGVNALKQGATDAMKKLLVGRGVGESDGDTDDDDDDVDARSEHGALLSGRGSQYRGASPLMSSAVPSNAAGGGVELTSLKQGAGSHLMGVTV